MNNSFKEELLEYASKLDALTKGYGKLSLYALTLVEEQDDSAEIGRAHV